jgi:Bacterial regulatory proteins, lacI family
LSRRVSVTVPANRSDRRVRITLHEIAKRANVSTATVSRTINWLVLRSSTNLAPGRLGEGAAGKRADSGLPPKKFHSESAEPVVKWP